MKRNTFEYLLGGLIAGLSLIWAASASASAIDYATLANTIPGEKGFPEAAGFAHTVDGITVTAHGLKFDQNNGPTYEDPTTTYNAYLDSNYQGRLGGLGVCKILSGDQCDPSSDDNLTNGEMLKLVFDTRVTISELLFRDKDHYDDRFAAGADFELAIDGGGFTSYTLVHTFNTPLTGSVFRFIIGDFANNGGTFQADSDQLYIQTVTFDVAAPEPGVLGLTGLGLLLIFGFSRWFRTGRH